MNDDEQGPPNGEDHGAPPPEGERVQRHISEVGFDYLDAAIAALSTQAAREFLAKNPIVAVDLQLKVAQAAATIWTAGILNDIARKVGVGQQAGKIVDVFGGRVPRA